MRVRVPHDRAEPRLRFHGIRKEVSVGLKSQQDLMWRRGISRLTVRHPDACFLWADPATTSGLPATAVPIDCSPSGLPIGVQVIGPYLEDRTTIAFAGLIERAIGGFVPPPLS